MIGRAISHYRVLQTLGAGGMGVVYLAEDGRLGRQVALKFLPPEASRDQTTLERFRLEARAASSLSHPGICTVFDIGDDAGSPFIVMEALKGETLRDRIKRAPITVAEVLDLAIQLADALEAAHSQGIVHRDIKPGNIFVGDKNRVKDPRLRPGQAGPADEQHHDDVGGRPADKMRNARLATDEPLEALVRVAVAHSLITAADLEWAAFDAGPPRPAADGPRFASGR